MLYTPIPGTPLHAELTAQGKMNDPATFDEADIHGQAIFNYKHPHIPAGMESELMTRAFDRDFERNGPSTLRIVRTTLAGWKRYKNHPDPRVRRRFAWEARELGTIFSAAAGGAKLYFGGNPAIRAKMAKLLDELHAEFGWKSRVTSAIGGAYVYWKLRREAKRLKSGWTYEPPTFCEKNDACHDRTADACRFVTPNVAPQPQLRKELPRMAQV
jgi:hypothetical protein